jgi:hypothetical protein
MSFSRGSGPGALRPIGPFGPSALGSVRSGAIVTNIETSLRAPPSAWQIPIAPRAQMYDGIAHSGAVGASPDRTPCRKARRADCIRCKRR